AGRIAGCLLVSSSQYNYFLSPSRSALIEQYAKLLALAFEHHEFYEPHQIELRVMPDQEEQKAYFANFRQRVANTMIEAARNRPPLRMEVRARSSLPAATAASSVESTGTLRGTAGFGFWNYPFSVRGDILMLPEAIWFFYASPPSNMALVPHIPGCGWKAQVVHSMRPAALASTLPLAVTAAFGMVTGETRQAARGMHRVSGAYDAVLP